MSFLTGIDPTTGMFVLPLWTVGLAVSLFCVLGVLAYNRTGRERLIGGLAPAALLLLGAGVSLLFLDGGPSRDLSAERRSLDARAQELLMRAAMQNSPLACLDTYAGEEFHAAVRAVIAATDEAAAEVSSSLRARMHAAFTRATQLEWVFWDSAFRLETWPV